jgi:hypothetical protein
MHRQGRKRWTRTTTSHSNSLIGVMYNFLLSCRCCAVVFVMVSCAMVLRLYLCICNVICRPLSICQIRLSKGLPHRGDCRKKSMKRITEEVEPSDRRGNAVLRAHEKDDRISTEGRASYSQLLRGYSECDNHDRIHPLIADVMLSPNRFNLLWFMVTGQGCR